MNKKILVISILGVLVVAALASGAYLLKLKSANKIQKTAPAVQDQKTPLQKGDSSGFDIPGEEEKAEATTKDIFQRIPKSMTGRLVRIVYRKMPLGGDKKVSSALSFMFYDDATKKTLGADYDMERGIFFKSASPVQLKGNPETVPASVIELGHDGMRRILEDSGEYAGYASKYPALSKNCTDTLSKDSRFGWEWRSVCWAAEGEQKVTVVFATNVETKKVTVVRSETAQ